MQYKELIEKMTLEEKASLMSGQNFWNTKSVERLGIPSMMMTDGPHGLRKQGGKADHLGLNASIPATCYPTAATLANSWDTSLLEDVGADLGDEATAEDVSVLLGPGLNIKRNPLCGRNFEYFSEDPYLSGKLAAAMIKGMQSKGIAACPKHFAVNSQEERRMYIDEIVDERALHEIYLEGFRYAIQEGGAKSIMTSYNRVNGTYANENIHLLQDILYGEWGFDGVAVTDWGGESNRVKGLVAGNQLEMPSSNGMTDEEIVAAVQRGELDESILDERVNSLLVLLYDTRKVLGKSKNFTTQEHHEKAKQAAKQSIVLLKNEEKTLPLSDGTKVAIIGDFAGTPRYQGAGSSLINPTYVDSALDALQKEELEIVGYAPGFDRRGKKNARKEKNALWLAEKADTILLFLGLDEGSESEGVDRSNMSLQQNQIDLLQKLAELNKKIVIVLAGGAPVEMPWEKQACAILHTYLGGQAGGSAITEILMGRYNPSGKLAETYPMNYQDIASAGNYPGGELTSEHRESIFVGYRYFDTAKINVQWPFGYGLSYTTFAYSNLKATKDGASFTVENTGNVAGAEIAQLYVHKKDSKIFRAEKELKGFAKVFLEPGQEQTVEISFDTHTFSYFNVQTNAWQQEGGEYSIWVGASSREIHLSEDIKLKGDNAALPYDAKTLPSYFSGDVKNVPDTEFVQILGRELPPSKWDDTQPLGYHNTIEQGKNKKGFARFLYNFIRFARWSCLLVNKPIAANYVMFVMHLPYLQMARMSAGVLDMPMLDALLVMVNGHFWKGVPILFKAWRAKRKKEKLKKKNK